MIEGKSRRRSDGCTVQLTKTTWAVRLRWDLLKTFAKEWKAEFLDSHILQVPAFTAALVDVSSRRGKSTSRILSRKVT